MASFCPRVTEFAQPAVEWIESNGRMRGGPGIKAGPGINMLTRGI
jgi:hypothetical protein